MVEVRYIVQLAEVTAILTAAFTTEIVRLEARLISAYTSYL
jgi:hypothetical protein